MARKKIVEDTEPKQLELVKPSVSQIKTEITNNIAEYKTLSLKINALEGEVKLLKNQRKEKLERAEQLSAQVASPRVKESLEAALAELADSLDSEDPDEEQGEETEGRYMDQSKIKKPDELRRQPHADSGDDDSSDREWEEE
jgi:hypothetical protein